ncbi:MAG TPA: alpha/beta-type small acid-soluble spore protein [bacterium]|jgi:hypothetical protein|nr:alpha/beta-type small acid-soluble spore protein [bacterium]
MARGAVTRSHGGPVVPEAYDALNQWKYEVAKELGVDTNIDQGYWGHLPSRDCGSVGGHMTREMVKMAQQQMASQSKNAPPQL